MLQNVQYWLNIIEPSIEPILLFQLRSDNSTHFIFYTNSIFYEGLDWVSMTKRYQFEQSSFMNSVIRFTVLFLYNTVLRNTWSYSLNQNSRAWLQACNDCNRCHWQYKFSITWIAGFRRPFWYSALCIRKLNVSRLSLDTSWFRLFEFIGIRYSLSADCHNINSLQVIYITVGIKNLGCSLHLTTTSYDQTLCSLLNFRNFENLPKV